MQKSEQINELAAALAAAQGEIEPPIKNKKVSQKGVSRSGKEYNKEYFYADLPQIVEVIKKVLPKHGLSYSQMPGVEHGAAVLSTMIMHKSGQFIEGFVQMPQGMTPQELGSWLTYMKRYCLASAIGIAAEEDDDAGLAEEATQAVVSPPAVRSISPKKSGLATDNQRKLLYARMKKDLGISSINDMNFYLQKTFNIQSLESVGFGQVNPIIEAIDKAKQKTAPVDQKKDDGPAYEEDIPF